MKNWKFVWKTIDCNPSKAIFFETPTQSTAATVLQQQHYLQQQQQHCNNNRYNKSKTKLEKSFLLLMIWRVRVPQINFDHCLPHLAFIFMMRSETREDPLPLMTSLPLSLSLSHSLTHILSPSHTSSLFSLSQTHTHTYMDTNTLPLSHFSIEKDRAREMSESVLKWQLNVCLRRPDDTPPRLPAYIPNPP